MTQQTFVVDYGLTIIGGNSISSDTGFTTIRGNTGVELVATDGDSGATVGVEDTVASYMLAGNATAASNIVVSVDQVLTRTTGNVQLNVGDNTWLFNTAPLDPTEAYLYVPGGAAIVTPEATGGAGGKNIFIEAGAADQTTYSTSAGGELFLKGGRGATNDGGGGGQGGNVNINAGSSADPAGHGGNVYITSDDNIWTFDYTGALTLPSGANISIGSLNGGTASATVALNAFSPDGNTVSIQAQGNTSSAVIEVFANAGPTTYQWQFDSAGNLTAPGNISTVGNITAGNLSVTGNVVGNIAFTGSNVILNNASGAGGTDEGGELHFAIATANTTLSGPIAIDVYRDKMRFFDTTGNTRGMYIDFGNVDSVSNDNAIGYRDIPQIAFTGNATLDSTAAGKHYYSTLSTANVLTIANNTSVGWSVGTAITVVNRGTGNITIAQGTGVSLYLAGNSTAGNRTVTTYGMATLLNVAANVWMINGTGVS